MGLCTSGSSLFLPGAGTVGDSALGVMPGPIWDGEAERSCNIPLLGQLEVYGVPKVPQLLPLA